LKDTDGDMIGDEIELFNIRSNPADADTDKDGLSDYEEVSGDKDKDPTTLNVKQCVLPVQSVGSADVCAGETGAGVLSSFYMSDTDPTDPDTDDDGINDGN